MESGYIDAHAPIQTTNHTDSEYPNPIDRASNSSSNSKRDEPQSHIIRERKNERQATGFVAQLIANLSTRFAFNSHPNRSQSPLDTGHLCRPNQSGGSQSATNDNNQQAANDNLASSCKLSPRSNRDRCSSPNRSQEPLSPLEAIAKCLNSKEADKKSSIQIIGRHHPNHIDRSPRSVGSLELDEKRPLNPEQRPIDCLYPSKILCKSRPDPSDESEKGTRQLYQRNKNPNLKTESKTRANKREKHHSQANYLENSHSNANDNNRTCSLESGHNRSPSANPTGLPTQEASESRKTKNNNFDWPPKTSSQESDRKTTASDINNFKLAPANLPARPQPLDSRPSALIIKTNNKETNDDAESELDFDSCLLANRHLAHLDSHILASAPEASNYQRKKIERESKQEAYLYAYNELAISRSQQQLISHKQANSHSSTSSSEAQRQEEQLEQQLDQLEKSANFIQVNPLQGIKLTQRKLDQLIEQQQLRNNTRCTVEPNSVDHLDSNSNLDQHHLYCSRKSHPRHICGIGGSHRDSLNLLASCLKAANSSPAQHSNSFLQPTTKPTSKRQEVECPSSSLAAFAPAARRSHHYQEKETIETRARAYLNSIFFKEAELEGRQKAINNAEKLDHDQRPPSQPTHTLDHTHPLLINEAQRQESATSSSNTHHKLSSAPIAIINSNNHNNNHNIMYHHHHHHQQHANQFAGGQLGQPGAYYASSSGSSLAGPGADKQLIVGSHAHSNHQHHQHQLAHQQQHYVRAAAMTQNQNLNHQTQPSSVLSSDSSLSASSVFGRSARARLPGVNFLTRSGCCSKKCLIVTIMLLTLVIIILVTGLSAYLNFLLNLNRTQLSPLSGRLKILAQPAAAADQQLAVAWQDSLLNKTSPEFALKQQQLETILRGAFDRSQRTMRNYSNHLVKCEVYSFRPGSIWVYFRLFINKQSLISDSQLMRRKSPDEQLDKQFLPRITQQTLQSGFEQLLLSSGSQNDASLNNNNSLLSPDNSNHNSTPQGRLLRSSSQSPSSLVSSSRHHAPASRPDPIPSFDEQISRLMPLIEAIDLQSIQVTNEFDMLANNPPATPTLASMSDNLRSSGKFAATSSGALEPGSSGASTQVAPSQREPIKQNGSGGQQKQAPSVGPDSQQSRKAQQQLTLPSSESTSTKPTLVTKKPKVDPFLSTYKVHQLSGHQNHPNEQHDNSAQAPKEIISLHNNKPKVVDEAVVKLSFGQPVTSQHKTDYSSNMNAQLREPPTTTTIAARENLAPPSSASNTSHQVKPKQDKAIGSSAGPKPMSPGSAASTSSQRTVSTSTPTSASTTPTSASTSQAVNPPTVGSATSSFNGSTKQPAIPTSPATPTSSASIQDLWHSALNSSNSQQRAAPARKQSSGNNNNNNNSTTTRTSNENNKQQLVVLVVQSESPAPSPPTPTNTNSHSPAPSPTPSSTTRRSSSTTTTTTTTTHRPSATSTEQPSLDFSIISNAITTINKNNNSSPSTSGGSSSSTQRPPKVSPLQHQGGAIIVQNNNNNNNNNIAPRHQQQPTAATPSSALVLNRDFVGRASTSHNQTATRFVNSFKHSASDPKREQVNPSKPLLRVTTTNSNSTQQNNNNISPRFKSISPKSNPTTTIGQKAKPLTASSNNHSRMKNLLAEQQAHQPTPPSTIDLTRATRVQSTSSTTPAPSSTTSASSTSSSSSQAPTSKPTSINVIENEQPKAEVLDQFGFMNAHTTRPGTSSFSGQWTPISNNNSPNHNGTGTPKLIAMGVAAESPVANQVNVPSSGQGSQSPFAMPLPSMGAISAGGVVVVNTNTNNELGGGQPKPIRSHRHNSTHNRKLNNRLANTYQLLSTTTSNNNQNDNHNHHHHNEGFESHRVSRMRLNQHENSINNNNRAPSSDDDFSGDAALVPTSITSSPVGSDNPSGGVSAGVEMAHKLSTLRSNNAIPFRRTQDPFAFDTLRDPQTVGLLTSGGAATTPFGLLLTSGHTASSPNPASGAASPAPGDELEDPQAIDFNQRTLLRKKLFLGEPSSSSPSNLATSSDSSADSMTTEPSFIHGRHATSELGHLSAQPDPERSSSLVDRFGNRHTLASHIVNSHSPNTRIANNNNHLPDNGSQLINLAFKCHYYGCKAKDSMKFICLNNTQICDDFIDCHDESDELDCVSLLKHDSFAGLTNHRSNRLSFSNGAGIIYLNRRGSLAPMCIDYVDSQEATRLAAARGLSGAELEQVQVKTARKQQELIRQINTIGQYACSLQSFSRLISVKVNHHNLVDDMNLIRNSKLYHRLSILNELDKLDKRADSSSSPFDAYKSGSPEHEIEVSTSSECPSQRTVFVKCGSFECGQDSFSVIDNRNTNQKLKAGVINDFPWLVKLYWLGSLSCHGYLIDEMWLISSSECFTPYENKSSPSDWTAEISYEHYGNDDYQSIESNRRSIRDILIPDRIDTSKSSSSSNEDATSQVPTIVLTKLERPVRFSPLNRPICLPQTSINRTFEMELARSYKDCVTATLPLSSSSSSHPQSTNASGATKQDLLLKLAPAQQTNDGQLDLSFGPDATRVLICSTIQASRSRSKWTVVGFQHTGVGSMHLDAGKRLFTTVSSQIDWIIDTMNPKNPPQLLQRFPRLDQPSTSENSTHDQRFAGHHQMTHNPLALDSHGLVSISGNNNDDNISDLHAQHQFLKHHFPNETTIQQQRIQICNQFKCSTGECLSWSRICDGLYDCSSHEDERDCH